VRDSIATLRRMNKLVIEIGEDARLYLEMYKGGVENFEIGLLNLDPF
jgi:hypothetical protein